MVASHFTDLDCRMITKFSSSNPTKTRHFRRITQKIFWGGALPPPQTPPSVGRGTPPSHTPPPSAPQLSRLRRSVTPAPPQLKILKKALDFTDAVEQASRELDIACDGLCHMGSSRGPSQLCRSSYAVVLRPSADRQRQRSAI